MTEFKNRVHERSLIPPISTGFQGLDELLEGGLHEELYILAAGSSMGKSTFINQMANKIAEERDVLYFSIEMNKDVLIAQSISRLSYLLDDSKGKRNAKTIKGVYYGERSKPYSQDEKALISQAMYEYHSKVKHLHVFSGFRYRNLKEISNTVEKFITKTGRKPIVFVDYIQLLQIPGFNRSEKELLDEIICGLQEIIEKNSIPLFSVSSINRQNYNLPLELYAFKSSGGIEFGTDVALGIEFQNPQNAREEKLKEPREVQLTLLKDRIGMLGNIKFDYIAKFNLFVEEGTVAEKPSPKTSRKSRKMGLKEVA